MKNRLHGICKVCGEEFDYYPCRGSVAHYTQQGYSCLVIWENELSNQSHIVDKIKDFEGGMKNVTPNDPR